MLLHSLHRHVALVYSKKFALPCFKQYSTLSTKMRCCTIWRAFERNMAPFSKQNNISIEQLYSSKGHIAKGGTTLALKQKHTFFLAGFCIINGIYSRLLLHFLTVMLHTLQTRICSFKGETHVSMNVPVRWHSFQNHAVVFQKWIQCCRTAYYIFL